MSQINASALCSIILYYLSYNSILVKCTTSVCVSVCCLCVLSVCVCVCVYMFVCVCIHLIIHNYMYHHFTNAHRMLRAPECGDLLFRRSNLTCNEQDASFIVCLTNGKKMFLILTFHYSICDL